MILMSRATHGETIAARLASVAGHAGDVRLAALCVLIGAFCAITLGVSLYAVTRVQDSDVALLAMVFRIAEGVIGGIAAQRPLGLLWLATARGPDAPDPAAAHGLGAYLLDGQGGPVSAMFFAVGSLLFSWLLLRGRMIPRPLAGLGVLASAAWIVGLPLQNAGLLPGPLTYAMWILMAAFEVPFALWLIVKGVATPATPAAGRA
jgi:hypothetical protein